MPKYRNKLKPMFVHVNYENKFIIIPYILVYVSFSLRKQYNGDENNVAKISLSSASSWAEFALT
jgi:hypothetical protein